MAQLTPLSSTTESWHGLACEIQFLRNSPRSYHMMLYSVLTLTLHTNSAPSIPLLTLKGKSEIGTSICAYFWWLFIALFMNLSIYFFRPIPQLFITTSGRVTTVVFGIPDLPFKLIYLDSQHPIVNLNDIILNGILLFSYASWLDMYNFWGSANFYCILFLAFIQAPEGYTTWINKHNMFLT